MNKVQLNLCDLLKMQYYNSTGKNYEYKQLAGDKDSIIVGHFLVHSLR